MAAKGFPIVGDMIYGAATLGHVAMVASDSFCTAGACDSLASMVPIQLKAELPQELKDALGALEIQTIQTEDTEVLEAMGETMHQAMRDILDQREFGDR